MHQICTIENREIWTKFQYRAFAAVSFGNGKFYSMITKQKTDTQNKKNYWKKIWNKPISLREQEM